MPAKPLELSLQVFAFFLNTVHVDVWLSIKINLTIQKTPRITLTELLRQWQYSTGALVLHW